MAIQKLEGTFGSYIREAGEYLVEVNNTKTTKTKSKMVDGEERGKKPMLVVEFETEDGKTISGYFVKTLSFHMKALEQLKLACGLKVTDSADELVGKQCGILVEPKEANPETGRQFYEIVGYGKASDVQPNKPNLKVAKEEDVAEEEVPF